MEAGEEKTATEVRDRERFVNQQGAVHTDLLPLRPLVMEPWSNGCALTIKQEKPFRNPRKGLENFPARGDYSELPPGFGGT